MKPGIPLLAAFLALCLSGCQQDITLLDESGKIVGQGALKVTATFPSPAHLTLDGKEYSGAWSVVKIYEASMAKSRRLLSNRAALAYMSGNDPAYLKHGHVSFTAGDGSKIECDIYYRGKPGAGSCGVDGKQLKLTVRQG